MMKNNGAEWLTYRQAQELTGLGKTTLWRMVKAWTIPVSSHGRAKRINRQALEEYMWARTTSGGRPGEREDS